MGVRQRWTQHWRFFSWKSSPDTMPLRLCQSSRETFGRAYVLGVMSGGPTSSCCSLVTEFTDTTNDVAADGISEHRLTIESKQTLFCYVHETVNYSQHFVNLATGVHTKTVPYRPAGWRARQPWSADTKWRADICRRTSMSTYGKKSTWRGMHVWHCLRCFLAT